LKNRREFLTAGGGLASAFSLPKPVTAATRHRNFKAIAFDAFPVFDPRPIAALCESLFPGRGSDLVNLWRTRQFEYTWLRTISNRYADFEHVTNDSLTFVAKALKLDMAVGKREQLMQAHFELKTWPDAIPALKSLQEAGLRLAFLSNFTSKMLNSCIENSGLGGVFEQVLSTDLARTYKPDARAYQLGVEALKVPQEEILFAAFAGWDAAGAKSFGYSTFWVNRLGLPPEELDARPDATGSNLRDLLAFLG
jgi:2-haloacid dehalogenase